MTLTEVIESGKPFSIKLEDGSWSGWLKLVTDPYPWLAYYECSTLLEQSRLVEILFDKGCIALDNWKIADGI